MLPEPVPSFAFSPTPSSLMSPEPGVGFEEGVGRSFNVVIDADVVVVLVPLADAYDVASLVNGRVLCDLLHLRVAAAAPVGLDVTRRCGRDRRNRG